MRLYERAAKAVSAILWRHPFPSRLGLEVDHPLLVDVGLVVGDLVPVLGARPAEHSSG